LESPCHRAPRCAEKIERTRCRWRRFTTWSYGNARRFNEVKEKLPALEREFEQHFFSTLDAMPWSAAKVLGIDSSKGRVLVKLNQVPRSLIGIRVAIVPHQKLGLARLEDISKLVPSGQINGAKNGQVRGTYSLLYQYPRSPRRVLGGVVSSIKNQNQVATLKMDRDGLTELSVIMHEDPNKDILLSLLLGTASSALGCYQCFAHIRRFTVPASRN
jgi:hypothetical protein